MFFELPLLWYVHYIIHFLNILKFTQAEFDQIHEKVREVTGKDDSKDSSDEDEPFVDEYGNVVDNASNEDAIAAKTKELLSSPK